MIKTEYPPLEDMVFSGSILKDALLLAQSLVVPGITTKKIDKEVSGFIGSRGAVPSFLGYDGFPAACCISVNEEVVHAIPSSRKLKSGDIVSVDCGVIANGAHTDACRTFSVGDISEEARALLNTTLEALDAGIRASIVGNRIGNISNEIQRISELAGYSVSRQFIGHSIGYKLHLPPWIPSYGSKKAGAYLKTGMCLAIEPIVFINGWHVIEKSQWEIVSEDGCLSAHFEDTVVVTEGGPIVVTR